MVVNRWCWKDVGCIPRGSNSAFYLPAIADAGMGTADSRRTDSAVAVRDVHGGGDEHDRAAAHQRRHHEVDVAKVVCPYPSTLHSPPAIMRGTPFPRGPPLHLHHIPSPQKRQTPSNLTACLPPPTPPVNPSPSPSLTFQSPHVTLNSPNPLPQSAQPNAQPPPTCPRVTHRIAYSPTAHPRPYSTSRTTLSPPSPTSSHARIYTEHPITVLLATNMPRP